MKKIVVFFLVLALVLVEASVPKTSVVLADAASVSSVVFSTRQSDNHTILNITVLHFNYYPGHYVNSVQIDVNGTIYTTVPSST